MMAEENLLNAVAENVKKEEPITETKSVIDRADAVAQRLENANKKTEELLQRQEDIAAQWKRMMLSGRAEAGAPTKTPEQTALEKEDAEVKATINRFRR